MPVGHAPDGLAEALEGDIEVPLAILDLSRQHRLSDPEQGGALRGHHQVWADHRATSSGGKR